jgi:hypothetical protein
MKHKYNQDLSFVLNLRRIKYKADDVIQNLMSLTVIQIRRDFPFYWPNSAGSALQQKKIALQTMSTVIKKLSIFSNHNLMTVDEFRNQHSALSTTSELGDLFRKYGSDKSISHDYQLVYEVLFSNPGMVKKVFEIGIGSTNSRIISNMGPSGQPGSSLRAFRDFFYNAELTGVDIDREILFHEKRISTHYLNQLDELSFQELSLKVGDGFDLMIDDGLHTIDANLNSLNFFLPKLARGGYAVVEDIPAAATPVWLMMCRVLSDEGTASLVGTKNGLLFVFKKK